MYFLRILFHSLDRSPSANCPSIAIADHWHIRSHCISYHTDIGNMIFYRYPVFKPVNISLTNIELVYLPPNTTAHLQPMDAGIIHSFKAKYKQEFCKHLIYQFDSGIDYTK